MKAVIYCRVSTKEQTENFSLETQRKSCTDFCNKQSLEISKTFIEAGESAKTVNRTEFKKLLEYCRMNKGLVQSLVVYNVSRFARSMRDHAQVRAHLSSLGISLKSVTEPINDTATGKLMENVLASFAQFDNDVRGERTREGMMAALEKGRWPFKPPLGYIVSQAKAGDSILVADPERSSLIQRAFALYATGDYDRSEVLRTITALGLRTAKGRPVAPQTFQSLLANPIYAGFLTVERWAEKRRGNFQPLIDEETFQRVQAISRRKSIGAGARKQYNPDFVLRRFVKCGSCKKPLTGSWSKGRNDKYPYYRCPNAKCKAINIRRESLEKLFVEHLSKFSPKPEYTRLFNEIVLDVWHKKQATLMALAVSLRTCIDDLTAKKERLLEAFIYDKAIDRNTYRQQEAKLNEQLTIAELELSEAQADEFDVESVLQLVEHLLSNAGRTWQEYVPDQRVRFQSILFPEGVPFANGEFGTAVTSPIFSMLRLSGTQNESLATLPGIEPGFTE